MSKHWLTAKTKVEVVRRTLRLPSGATDRAVTREGNRTASLATRDGLATEIRDLDALTSDGLRDE